MRHRASRFDGEPSCHSSAAGGSCGWNFPDPQGRNPKRRPAVLVTPDVDIRADGDVWVVAISTQLDEAPAETQVELPWERQGHPRTRLKERCAAVCTWMEKVKVASIKEHAGIVPGRQLLDILAR